MVLINIERGGNWRQLSLDLRKGGAVSSYRHVCRGGVLRKDGPLGSSVSKRYNLSIRMSTGFKKPKPIGFGAGTEA